MMNKAKYVLKRECFDYNLDVKSNIDTIQTCATRQEAVELAEKLCKKEIEEKDGLIFNNFVETGEYDCQIITCDGDNYRIVTGYFIEEIVYQLTTEYCYREDEGEEPIFSWSDSYYKNFNMAKRIFESYTDEKLYELLQNEFQSYGLFDDDDYDDDYDDDESALRFEYSHEDDRKTLFVRGYSQARVTVRLTEVVVR